MARMLLCSLSAGLLALPACQSARINAVDDGRATWRAGSVPLVRDGGTVTVRVTASDGEEVTVLLVDADGMRELETEMQDVQPVAAARGRIRDGHFSVRFTELPAGTYHAHAFRDLDDDGCQTRTSGLFGAEYIDPHSGFEAVDVKTGSSHEIQLCIQEEQE